MREGRWLAAQAAQGSPTNFWRQVEGAADLERTAPASLPADHAWQSLVPHLFAAQPSKQPGSTKDCLPNAWLPRLSALAAGPNSSSAASGPHEAVSSQHAQSAVVLLALPVHLGSAACAGCSRHTWGAGSMHRFAATTGCLCPDTAATQSPENKPANSLRLGGAAPARGTAGGRSTTGLGVPTTGLHALKTSLPPVLQLLRARCMPVGHAAKPGIARGQSGQGLGKHQVNLRPVQPPQDVLM